MKKLTDEEIIRAQECCYLYPHKFTNECRECEIANIVKDMEDKTCQEFLAEQTLDLINRQKAEIDKLNNLIDKTNEQRGRVINAITRINEVKFEAYKEFAERLKDIDMYQFIEEYYENAELCYEVRDDLFKEHIDNIIKEMVGENNA